MRDIRVSDITMREAIASKALSLSFKEKLEIVKILDRIGVGSIEVEGIESSKVDSLRIKSIASLVKNSTLAVPVKMDDDSIQAVWNAAKGAKHVRLQVEAAVSPSCMEYIQRKKADTLIADAADAVAKCAQLTDDVEFVAIDATRTDVAYLARVIDAVVAAGAKTVTVCDAAGSMLPEEFAQFIADLYEAAPQLKDIDLGISCCNNLNMADACAVAGVMAGAFGDAAWNVQPAAFDFFDGKGVVENLMRELAIPKVRYKALSAQEAPHLQPGRAAQVLSGGTVLGWVGELHPLACAAYDAQAPVVAFELDVEALAKACRPARDYVDVPTFPAVSIDQAFVVDEDVTHERLEQCMSSAGGKLLAEVRLFDVYRDSERIGQGKKSMAYALTYRAADRTLTGEEVDKAHAKLVKKVCGATGAEVRA